VYTLSGCSTQRIAPADARKAVDWEAIAQEHDVVSWTRVQSLYGSLQGRRTIELTDDIVVIVVAIDDVMEYLEGYNGPMEQQFADALRGTYAEFDVLREEDVTNMERWALDYAVADLLEQGRFVVTVKGTRTVAKEIVIGRYMRNPGPLSGTGGRLFFLLDGREFYGTLDWMA
jgi:hypothetical protein